MQKLVTFYTPLFQVEEVRLFNLKDNYCAGEPLAKWLIDKLEKSGFLADKLCQEHCCWMFDVRKAGEKFFVMIDPDEQTFKNGSAEWTMIVEKSKPWFSFKKQNISTFEEFCREIDNILREESEISEIKWEDQNLPN